ncbi:MAG TPA: SDR family oxidoreductase [Elusimicrobiota bacterium]|nr:SDR family oxidoreductase [Elusimicrobiota bacterium]
MGKILVVGGGGYVGSVLCRELLDRGFAVKVADRFYYGNAGLNDIKERIEIQTADLRALTPADLENVDAVVNLGGLSNDPTAEYSPEANWDINALGAEHLAKLSREAGVRRYILASSASVYDLGSFDEDEDVVQTEESKVKPKAAYAVSKLEAERRVLALADKKFCPVILRKGTVYGFSPRMRYDLVVNTFVKDALSSGHITLYYGGEMWRPMVEIHDVSRAYILAIQAPAEKVCAQVFNVVHRNFRISEVGLRVKQKLVQMGVPTKIQVDYTYRGVRNYRVSGRKIRQVLGWNPVVTVDESVEVMVGKIRELGYTNFDHPRYYNIEWLKLLQETRGADPAGKQESIFSVSANLPAHPA